MGTGDVGIIWVMAEKDYGDEVDSKGPVLLAKTELITVKGWLQVWGLGVC